ncbi:MAG: hypothetical protein V4650_11430 [Pseudomonadota bacterium]
MSIVDPKTVTAFLQSVIKNNQTAVAPAQRDAFDRAALCLRAADDLQNARQSLQLARSEIEEKGGELQRLETAAQRMRLQLSDLESKQDSTRRSRVGAAVDEAMAGNSKAWLIHDTKLATEIADLRSVLQEAETRLVSVRPAVDRLQSNLRTQRRLAMEARERISDGPLMYLESLAAVAYSECVAALRLAGNIGEPRGVRIQTDPGSLDSAFERLGREMSDVLA